MAVCYLVLLLISLFSDSETNVNINLFDILSDLVSVRTEIQRCQRRQVCCSRGCGLCGSAKSPYYHLKRNNPNFNADAKKKGTRKFLQFSNPAFGGRGTGPAIFKRSKAKLHGVRNSNWRHSHANNEIKYNKTLGFHGEGWWKNFSVSTWNPRSLTKKERFEYCKSLGYDVLALTELWKNQSSFQTRSKRFIVSEPAAENLDIHVITTND